MKKQKNLTVFDQQGSAGGGTTTASASGTTGTGAAGPDAFGGVSSLFGAPPSVTGLPSGNADFVVSTAASPAREGGKDANGQQRTAEKQEPGKAEQQASAGAIGIGNLWGNLFGSSATSNPEPEKGRADAGAPTDAAHTTQPATTSAGQQDLLGDLLSDPNPSYFGPGGPGAASNSKRATAGGAQSEAEGGSFAAVSTAQKVETHDALDDLLFAPAPPHSSGGYGNSSALNSKTTDAFGDFSSGFGDFASAGFGDFESGGLSGAGGEARLSEKQIDAFLASLPDLSWLEATSLRF